MNSITRVCVLLLATFAVARAVCHTQLYCLNCPAGTDGINRCTECSGLFGLDNSNPPKCIQCSTLSGCQLCKNVSRCDVCQSTKLGPDSNGQGTCSPCPQGCARCSTDSQVCDICSPGFVKVAGGACQSCPSFCRSCKDGATCTKCNKGYYQKASAGCSPCTPHCDVCRNDDTCDACLDGYFVNSATKKCSECGVTHCKKCFDGQTCDVCYDGFYLKNDRECAACPENCRYCNNKGKCLGCKGRKIGPDGSCVSRD